MCTIAVELNCAFVIASILERPQRFVNMQRASGSAAFAFLHSLARYPRISSQRVCQIGQCPRRCEELPIHRARDLSIIAEDYKRDRTRSADRRVAGHFMRQSHVETIHSRRASILTR